LLRFNWTVPSIAADIANATRNVRVSAVDLKTPPSAASRMPRAPSVVMQEQRIPANGDVRGTEPIFESRHEASTIQLERTGHGTRKRAWFSAH
jgi:hypothetical protein